MSRAPRPACVVYRALGLGDFLTGVPAFRALARAFPEHRRLLAAPAALAPLLPLTGALDGIVATEPLSPVTVPFPVDTGVNLHGRGPQSHRALLAAGPRRLIAFAHPEIPQSSGGPAWAPDVHETVRWCRMLEAHGIPADPGDLLLSPPGIPPPCGAGGATVIHPGAASEARRWPPQRWARVAAREWDAGRPVVITAGPGEEGLAAEVADAAGLSPRDVVADLDVLQLAAIVAGAGRVLSGDTGIAHLAAAFRVPSITLFGPTSPALWGPPANGPHIVLWAGTTGDPHAGEADPGLLRITVEDVLEALDRLEDAAVTAPSS